ncbi:MAG TPA: ABC transporter permease [Thermoanaerobaculia bacterium]|jgi:lipopolysaccharide transport system permease protein|nr:ABC transporter permease [Thermoanaerobaculia bacterium]
MHKVLRPRHGLARLKLAEVWEYRELMFFLAWRDILVRYKQTEIGILWAFIRPFITMVIFTIVFGRMAKLPSANLPYPVFALAGLLPWQLFSTAFSEASSSIVGAGQLVSKVYFPRLIIPISATFSVLVDFLVSALMLAALMLWYKVPISMNTLWVIPLTALCMLAAIGSGILFAALYVRYRDIRHVLPFIVQFGLYISPVGFMSTMIPAKWRLLYSLNPMVGVIDGFRWALFGGTNAIDVQALTLSIVLTVMVLIGGLYYFRNTERVFADII